MSQWLHYQKNLAGEKVSYHDGVVESGYYRTRLPWIPANYKIIRAGKGWNHPVGIWRERGRLVGFYGRMQEPMTYERIIDVWAKCCCFPISYEVYLAVCQGEEWQDSSIRRKPKGEPKSDQSDHGVGNSHQYGERKPDPYAPQVDLAGNGPQIRNGV